MDKHILIPSTGKDLSLLPATTPALGSVQPAVHWVSGLTTDLCLPLCLNTWTYISSSWRFDGLVTTSFQGQIYLHLSNLHTTLSNSDSSIVEGHGKVFIFFSMYTIDLMWLTMKCSSTVLKTATFHLNWSHRKKLCYFSSLSLCLQGHITRWP